jgi:hypothetical protein
MHFFFLYILNLRDIKTPITITCLCVHSIKLNACDYIVEYWNIIQNFKIFVITF